MYFLGQMSRNSKISVSRKSPEFWTEFGLTGDSSGHWPIVTLTYIEKFDSLTGTSQINLPVSC